VFNATVSITLHWTV